MPWIEGKRKDDREYYALPRDARVCPNMEELEWLLAKKQQHRQDHELFIRRQKEFGREYPDTGRFFREAAAEELKYYRAFCYVIGKVMGDNYAPGDCRNLQANRELAIYIDRVWGWLNYPLPVHNSVH